MPPRIAVDDTRLRELWDQRPALPAEEIARALGICRSLMYVHAWRLGLATPRPRPPRRGKRPVYHFGQRG